MVIVPKQMTLSTSVLLACFHQIPSLEVLKQQLSTETSVAVMNLITKPI